jgi:hypothetical protein
MKSTTASALPENLTVAVEVGLAAGGDPLVSVAEPARDRTTATTVETSMAPLTRQSRGPRHDTRQRVASTPKRPAGLGANAAHHRGMSCTNREKILRSPI